MSPKKYGGTTFHFTVAANRDVLLEPRALVNAQARRRVIFAACQSVRPTMR